MAKVIAVIGAQWGDEGKGKIVDLLAERFDIVVRSVQVGDQSFVLHLLPSGIVHRGKTCVLGNGMVIDPKAFFVEADRLTGGLPVQLAVDDECRDQQRQRRRKYDNQLDGTRHGRID